MAKYSTGLNSFTPVGTADTTTMTTLTYLGLIGGAATQRTAISEIYMGGQATSSQAMWMVFARDSTNAATPVAPAAAVGWNGPLDVNSTALASPVVAFNTATTGPSRATTATLARLNLSYNAFGGIVRWTAMDPTEWYIIYGTGTSAGEATLSAFTGSGASGVMGCHIIYETM